MSFNLQPLQVSRESVRKIALKVDRYVLTRQRYGRQVADTKCKPRGAGVVTTRPLQRVEMDHFLCDVHLICEKTGARLGRPWLTLAVDHYSGMVLGYYLSFAPPSSSSVLAALRHAILPKETSSSASLHRPIGGTTMSGARWLAFGIPDLLVVDNGLDLTSAGTREACSALGIEVFFTPPRSPWYKGVIERVGRTMNTRMIHWLPGTTLGKPTSDLGYNGADEAILTFEDFKGLLEQYFTTIHNKAPTRTRGQSPEKMFMKGCLEWPVRVPTSMSEFDAAVALSKNATLQQSGLTFLRLRYQSDALGVLFNRSPSGTRLHFKVNPLNLKTIQVRHPATGEYFAVDCIDELSWPRTLSMHLAVRAHAKKLGLNPDELKELARAERDLMNAYHEAAKSSRKSLRRMHAELLRQSNRELDAEDEAAQKDTAASLASVKDVFDEVFGDE